MTNNASNLAKLAKDEVVYATNWAYGKMMAVFGFVLVYLLSLWGLTAWGGYGVINIAMWLFVILLTKIYWQPNVGGIAALGEFFYHKDDPAKKSVWRLYLLLIISAVVAGYVAIVCRMIGAPTAFPQIILVIVVCIAAALLLPNSHLDEWLPWITGTIVVLAIAGVIPQMNPHLLKKVGITLTGTPQSEIAANELGDADVKIQDDRLQKQLRWTKALMECKHSDDARKKWAPEQATAYKSLCEANGNITLEEMGKYWPPAKKVWEDSYAGRKPIKAGGSKTGEVAGNAAFIWSQPATWSKWVSENPGYALVLLILHIPVFWGIKWAWNRRNGAVATAGGKAKESLKLGPALLWLGAAGGLGWGGYTVLSDNPNVPSMETMKDVVTGRNAMSTPSSTVRREPALMLGDAPKYEALYQQPNPHKGLPQYNYHGTKKPLGDESYVADKISLRVLLDESRPEWNLLFNGQCASATDSKAKTPKSCWGIWSNEGGSQSGEFYLRWDTGGSHFVIEIFLGKLPADASVMARVLNDTGADAKVMVRLKK